jgi:hypothetical protein
MGCISILKTLAPASKLNKQREDKVNKTGEDQIKDFP